MTRDRRSWCILCGRASVPTAADSPSALPRDSSDAPPTPSAHFRLRSVSKQKPLRRAVQDNTRHPCRGSGPGCARAAKASTGHNHRRSPRPKARKIAAPKRTDAEIKIETKRAKKLKWAAISRAGGDRIRDAVSTGQKSRRTGKKGDRKWKEKQRAQ